MKIYICTSRGETEEKEREAKCLLKHTGYVWWLVHRTHKSACLFDVTNYPFDEHTCHMWFQSIEVCVHLYSNLCFVLKLIDNNFLEQLFHLSLSANNSLPNAYRYFEYMLILIGTLRKSVTVNGTHQ